MLINKAECRKNLLARAEQRWPGKMTSVQKEVFEHLDALVRIGISNFVSQHPTKGKTLMLMTRKRKGEANGMV